MPAPVTVSFGQCTFYIIKRPNHAAIALIDTRGTGERQGPSSGFITMNKNILSQVPGGTEV